MLRQNSDAAEQSIDDQINRLRRDGIDLTEEVIKSKRRNGFFIPAPLVQEIYNTEQPNFLVENSSPNSILSQIDEQPMIIDNSESGKKRKLSSDNQEGTKFSKLNLDDDSENNNPPSPSPKP